MSGNRLVFTIIFLAVFLLMMIIGLVSGVSLGAGLTRAIQAAVFFTALSLITSVIIERYVISDIKRDAQQEKEDAIAGSENIGRRLDITVTEPPEQVPGTPDIAGDSTAEKHETNQEGFSDQGLGPLVTRQIDPNVEKVINSDPKRMADIIKKMGFEE